MDDVDLSGQFNDRECRAYFHADVAAAADGGQGFAERQAGALLFARRAGLICSARGEA